jgi:hypothetical protein
MRSLCMCKWQHGSAVARHPRSKSLFQECRAWQSVRGPTGGIASGQQQRRQRSLPALLAQGETVLPGPVGLLCRGHSLCPAGSGCSGRSENPGTRSAAAGAAGGGAAVSASAAGAAVAAEALPLGDPSGWRVGQLKRVPADAGVDCSHCIEKDQLVELCSGVLAGPASGSGAAAALADSSGSTAPPSHANGSTEAAAAPGGRRPASAAQIAARSCGRMAVSFASAQGAWASSIAVGSVRRGTGGSTEQFAKSKRL